MLLKFAKMIYISQQQHEWLQEKAKELGISQSEYIRRVLDEKREKEQKQKKT